MDGDEDEDGWVRAQLYCGRETRGQEGMDRHRRNGKCEQRSCNSCKLWCERIRKSQFRMESGGGHANHGDGDGDARAYGATKGHADTIMTEGRLSTETHLEARTSKMRRDGLVHFVHLLLLCSCWVVAGGGRNGHGLGTHGGEGLSVVFCCCCCEGENEMGVGFVLRGSTAGGGVVGGAFGGRN